MQFREQSSALVASLLTSRIFNGYYKLQQTIQRGAVRQRCALGAGSSGRLRSLTASDSQKTDVFASRVRGTRMAFLRKPSGKIGAPKMNTSVSLRTSKLRARRASTLSLAELREWLSRTPDRTTGAPLAARLVSSIDNVVIKFARAYSSGPFGFTLNAHALQYPTNRLLGLRERIESGDVDDLLIIGFPSTTELSTLGLSPLLSVSQFMAMQIAERQRPIAMHDLRELDTYRFAGDNIAQCEMKFGTYSPSIHRAMHAVLREQPRVLDVAGEVAFVFTSCMSAPAKTRGTFAEAVKKGARLLNLSEYLAAMLVTGAPDGRDPVFNKPEWVGAITRNLAAYVTISGAGLRVRCTAPDDLRACSRYRMAY
jgi:hypothetical protein